MRVLKAAALTTQILSIFVFLWGLSFYNRPFPTHIDEASGRTYALNNHGSVKYMNRTEWLEHNVAMDGGMVVLILATLALQRLDRRGSKSAKGQQVTGLRK